MRFRITAGIILCAVVSHPSIVAAQEVVTSPADEANETVRLVKAALMAIASILVILTILFWIHTDPKRRAKAFARKRDREAAFEEQHRTFLESEAASTDSGPRYAALPIVEPDPDVEPTPAAEAPEQADEDTGGDDVELDQDQASEEQADEPEQPEEPETKSGEAVVVLLDESAGEPLSDDDVSPDDAIPGLDEEIITSPVRQREVG